MNLPLLSIVTFLPLLGALLILALRLKPGASEPAAPWIALWTTIATLALSLLLWAGFTPHQPGFQFEEQVAWMPSLGISYHMGLDGISLMFVLLTTALSPLAIAASWRLITVRRGDYMMMMLLLQTFITGLFSALDFVLFYVFFEATLIPGALLIGIWGGAGRVRAAIRFFLYTFCGSLFMLLALIVMQLVTGTTDIPTLLQTRFSPDLQAWLFLGMVLAFGVKLPIFPLHSWLPDAYAEAPAPATAILSGVLSKAGAYGMLRFAIEMLPDAAHRFAPIMITLGLAAMIYAAVIALAQTDMKRVIAWSSFSHMGLALVGLFTLNAYGIAGAQMMLLAHGVIVAGLFLSISMLAVRGRSQEISAFGGVAGPMPRLATLAMLFTMANLGLPGTGSFVGELLVVIGAVHVNFWVALLAASIMVLGAIYMLFLYRRVLFGSVASLVSGVRDLNPREIAILAPLAFVILWMGIYPVSFTGAFNPQVTNMAENLSSHAPKHEVASLLADPS